MSYCLLLSIFVSLIGGSWPQTTIIRDVVPDSYTTFRSNQYDSNFQCLQDPQCSIVNIPGKKRSSGNQELLTCTGPNSTLFDGVIGRDISRRDMEQTDITRHYTWHQDTTSSPRIEMFFDSPLVELPNVTMYFYREGPIRAPLISMCFSRTFNFNPCIPITLPERPDILNGIVVWSIPLLTNATLVRFLRINMQYDRDFNDYIFLSEIRVAERLQVQVTTPTPSSVPLPTPSSTLSSSPPSPVTQTPALIDEDDNPVNITSITITTPHPTGAVNNNTGIVTNEGRFDTSSGDDNSSSAVGVIAAVVVVLVVIVFIVIILVVVLVVWKRKRTKQLTKQDYSTTDKTMAQTPQANRPELMSTEMNDRQGGEDPQQVADQIIMWKRGYNTDDMNTQQSSDHQHIHNTSGEVDPTSKQETVNALYIPTKVASLDSLMRRIDHRTGVDVIVTPNPSYAVQNSSQSGQQSEYQYDYVQTAGDDDDGVVKQVQSTTTPGGDKVSMDNVNIDPNPSYSILQDVKLQDNPSHDPLHGHL